MSITSVSSLYATSSTSVSSASTSSTSSTSDIDFLSLLVTQLQNQNPLDPTDTSELMQQVMSYANYSQQVAMSEQLSNLTTTINGLFATSLIGFVGNTVEAYGDTNTLLNGSANWGYSLDGAASTVTITVKDADGNAVYETAGETAAGKHTFTWDGTTTDGTHLTEGTYTIEVTATDSSGASVYGYTTITGEVTGIDSSSGVNMLQIGGIEVAVDDVLGVKA